MDQIRDQKIRRSERWQINQNGPTQEISALLLRTFFDAVLFFSSALFRKARMSFAFGRKAALRLSGGMSALGQKQTFAVQKGMSALPPKADTRRSIWDVR